MLQMLLIFFLNCILPIDNQKVYLQKSFYCWVYFYHTCATTRPLYEMEVKLESSFVTGNYFEKSNTNFAKVGKIGVPKLNLDKALPDH